MQVINLENLRHGVRVADLALKLAHLLNLNKGDRQDIYFAALFHDIGKSSLDQKILNKPSKLNKEERKHIELHSYFGYQEILKMGYNSNIALNILYHHENYNGSGYPTGLKGKNIPIGGRIIRICDMFDALISDRPYRKGLSVNEALKIMDNESFYFDSFIYDLFLESVVVVDEKFDNRQRRVGYNE